jgi:branched-chain amino acid transport system substrate-binding protein
MFGHVLYMDRLFKPKSYCSGGRKMKNALKNLVMFGLAAMMIIALVPAKVKAEPKGDEWVIPFLSVRTGPWSGWARMFTAGAEYAAEQINANGGINGKKIVFEYHDTANDPAKTVAEMSKILDRNLLIFGPVYPDPQKAALPMVKRKAAFAFAVTVPPDVLAKFKPHTIGLWPKFDPIVKEAQREWIKANPDIKSVVIIVDPGISYFTYFQKVYRKNFEEMGIKVLNDVQVAQGVDKGSAVIKAMGQKPDAYTPIAGANDTAPIVRELDKRGLKEKRRLFLYCSVDSPRLYTAVNGLADGAYLWNVVNRLSDNEGWKTFTKKFKKDNPGLSTDMAHVPAINMVYLAKQAVETLGLTGDPKLVEEEWGKMIAYLSNLKGYKGITTTFDIVDSENQSHGFLFRIKENDLEMFRKIVY